MQLHDSFVLQCICEFKKILLASVRLHKHTYIYQSSYHKLYASFIRFTLFLTSSLRQVSTVEVWTQIRTVHFAHTQRRFLTASSSTEDSFCRKHSIFSLKTISVKSLCSSYSKFSEPSLSMSREFVNQTKRALYKVPRRWLGVSKDAAKARTCGRSEVLHLVHAARYLHQRIAMSRLFTASREAKGNEDDTECSLHTSALCAAINHRLRAGSGRETTRRHAKLVELRISDRDSLSSLNRGDLWTVNHW